MSARPLLVGSLTAALACLLLAAPAARAAWRPVDYIYVCDSPAAYFNQEGYQWVLETIDNKPLSMRYTVGKRTSYTTDSHVTVKATCYTVLKLSNSQPVSYSFAVDGLSSLAAWIVLDVVPGTRPGPPPLTWTQRAYCNTEWHHSLTEVAGANGLPPGPTYSLEWHSTAKVLGTPPMMAGHYQTWWDPTWSGNWGWLHALSAWQKVTTTGYFAAAHVHAALVVNCTLLQGELRLKADTWVTSYTNPACWGAEYP